MILRRIGTESYFSRLKSANTSVTGRDWSDLACDNPVSIIELNSLVVIESKVVGF